MNRMIRSIVLSGFILFFTHPAFSADYFTDNYNLRVPEENTFDWTSKLSNDIISLDAIMYQVSTDSAFVDKGSTVVLRTNTDIVGVGTQYPIALNKLTVSADTVGKDMFKVVSKDTLVVFGVDKANRLIVSSDPGQITVGGSYTGGVVGRIRVVSPDGNTCYIPLYSGS